MSQTALDRGLRLGCQTSTKLGQVSDVQGALSETVWEAPGPVDRDRIANLSLHRSELDGDMSGPRSGKDRWKDPARRKTFAFVGLASAAAPQAAGAQRTLSGDGGQLEGKIVWESQA
ncbi:hypothetical protein CCHR01_01809 [Colletotrichum chrysophilum]|uniref:Uncharacterized protein n=1 Tax=Colletotrichum chrysophilum TaxID=1836956 RepID=A0AAD9AY97_9PEZI|nr:hypothetical protein CCHR01_01809 [Colletotrichum chrysophilum]